MWFARLPFYRILSWYSTRSFLFHRFQRILTQMSVLLVMIIYITKLAGARPRKPLARIDIQRVFRHRYWFMRIGSMDLPFDPLHNCATNTSVYNCSEWISWRKTCTRRKKKNSKKLTRNLIENEIYFTLKIRDNFAQVVLCNFIRVRYISLRIRTSYGRRNSVMNISLLEREECLKRNFKTGDTCY